MFLYLAGPYFDGVRGGGGGERKTPTCINNDYRGELALVFSVFQSCKEESRYTLRSIDVDVNIHHTLIHSTTGARTQVLLLKSYLVFGNGIGTETE